MSQLRRRSLHHARLRVQYPYEQAFDKSIVLACCIAAAMGLAADARLVTAFCLGVIASSLAEVAQGERTRRTSEATSYVYIIAAVFVPPFVAVCASRPL